MTRITIPLRERVLRRLVIEPGTGCLLWTGALRKGYGEVSVGGNKTREVHQLMYEWFVGPVPEGLELDHLCRVRRCASPAHLEAVTHAENMRRGTSLAAANAAKTHCQEGHEFNVTNTIIVRTGARMCRPCKNRLWREAYHAGRFSRSGGKPS